MLDLRTLFRSPAFIALLLVLGLGVWLRLPEPKHRAWKGADEGYYERYVTQLDDAGLLGWPKLQAGYIERQTAEPYAFLPPTRVLFIGSAHVWRLATGTTPLESIRVISCAAGIATLLIGAAIAGRLGGLRTALGVSALLAASPLLIHLSHRALIDGFFALWALVALWGLWECLRAPGHKSWLTVYAVGLAAMVLTKENAAFAFIGLGAIIVANRWLKIGRVTPVLLATTVIAPALAAIFLVICSGGISPLLDGYRLNVAKSVILPYAISTGDGPWHRYLVDFLLVSPGTTILAIAAIGATPWIDPAKRLFVVFVVVTYAIQAQVRYGMNMRYGAMWELPLCWLSFILLAALTTRLAQRYQTPALTAAIVLTCGIQLHSYHRLFVASDVYDPVAGALTQVLRMWKPMGTNP